MRQLTPIGAVWRGVLSGIAGAGAQSLFFKWAGKWAPPIPEDAFHPPEPEQRDELATHTVARRIVRDLAKRGPLTKEQKQLGGEIVHYSFGGLWGGVYGLTVESLPALKTPIGAAAFSSFVWMASDNFILPAFKLGAWPHHYPLKNHAFYWAAHLAYGAGLWLTFTSLTTGWLFAGAAIYAVRANRRIGRFVPKRVAKVAAPIIWQVARRPVVQAVEAAGL